MPDIREPWAVYEMDTATGLGTDSVGNGPAMDANGSGAGILGQANFGLQNPTPTSFDFVLDSGQNSSFGFWYNLKAEDLVETDSVFANLVIDQTPATDYLEFQFAIISSVLSLRLVADVDKVVATGSLAAGWHYLSFSKTGSSVQFFVNGAAVGSASAITIASTGGNGSEIVGVNNGWGLVDQITFAQVAYTAEEWAYIYNSGAGRLYADWNPPAAGGNGRINLLTMGVG